MDSVHGTPKRAFWATILISCSLLGCLPSATEADLNGDGWVDDLDLAWIDGCLTDVQSDPDCSGVDPNGDGVLDELDRGFVRFYRGAVVFDPTWPEFEPELIDASGSDLVHLLDRQTNRIYRYSRLRGRVLRPLEAGSGVESMAYSSENDALYLGYPGVISVIRRGGPVEFFASVGGSPSGMKAVGERLFVTRKQALAAYHELYSANGVTVWSLTLNDFYAGQEIVWDSAAQRIYFDRRTRLGSSVPSYFELNAETGHPIDFGEMSGDGLAGRFVRGPSCIDVSLNRLVLQSGEVFDVAAAEPVDAFASNLAGITCLGQGEIAGLTGIGDEFSQVEVWDEAGQRVDLVELEGKPLGVYAEPNGFLALTLVNSVPTPNLIVSSTDRDGDGVETSLDVFPLDPSVAYDSDGDGAPDKWNAGYAASLVHPSLQLDAFPRDASCQRAEDGTGGPIARCDVLLGQDPFEPAVLEIDSRGIVYALDPENQRIHRYSTAYAKDLAPLVIGQGAETIALSSDGLRLLVAYASGKISKFATTDLRPSESSWANTFSATQLLLPVGSFYYAGAEVDSETPSLVILDESGRFVSVSEEGPNSDALLWVEEQERLYFVTRDLAPRLGAIQVDSDTGEVGVPSLRDARTSESYDRDPMVALADGAEIATGGGSVYDAGNLSLVRRREALPAPWVPLDSGGAASLWNDEEGASWLVRWDTSGRIVQQSTYEGEPIDVLALGDDAVLATRIGGRPRYTVMRFNEDADGDGVIEERDAFPLDPAASVDSDGDGAPDEWNVGQDAADSTLGLTLDAFPNDAFCQLYEQGQSAALGECDSLAIIDAFRILDTAVDLEGILYVLTESELIYRYSPVEDRLIGSIKVDSDASKIVYSAALHRLYVANSGDTLDYFDLNEEPPIARTFVEAPTPDGGLAVIGEFLFFGTNRNQLPYGERIPEHFVYDADGNLIDREVAPLWMRGAIWDAPRNRILWSSSSLFSTEVDPATGQIGTIQELGIDSDHWNAIEPRISGNGEVVYAGRRRLFDLDTFEERGALSGRSVFRDVRFLGAEGTLSLRVTSNADLGFFSTLERWDARGLLVDRRVFAGFTSRIIPLGNDRFVFFIRDEEGRFRTEHYSADDAADGDGDGVSFSEDAFPDDAAASIDSDGDGAPDEWNVGFGEDDSTTGLRIDAFPTKAACRALRDADPLDSSVCDIEGSVGFIPLAQVRVDDSGIAFISADRSRQIFRYDLEAREFLDPLIAPAVPTHLAVEGQGNRIFIATEGGAVFSVGRDEESGGQFELFYSGVGGFTGLASIGEYLYGSRRGTNSVEQLLFNQEGDTEVVVPYGVQYPDDGLVRLESSDQLFLRDDDEFLEVDLSLSEGLPSLTIGGTIPVRSLSPSYERPVWLAASPSGDRIIAETGVIYDASTLEPISQLTGYFSNAVWANEETLVTYTDSPFGRELKQWNAEGVVVNRVELGSRGTALLKYDGRVYYITVEPMSYHTQVIEFIVNDDVDGDGVPSEEDAFIFDIAASVDADGDGAPDAWNPGYDASDSTTSLILDAFPDQPACQLPEHEREDAPGRCDISRTIPTYRPGFMALGENGVLYVASGSAVPRLDRYDVADRHHLAPVVLREGERVMGFAYRAESERLYVVYEGGAVDILETEFPDALFRPFLQLDFDPGGLAVRGDRIEFYSSSYPRTRVYSEDGEPIDEWALATPGAWNSALNIYYEISELRIGDHSERGQLRAVFDLENVFSDRYYRVAPDDDTLDAMYPLVISPDGSRVLDGSGQLYEAQYLRPLAGGPQDFDAGSWYRDGLLVVARNLYGRESFLEHWTDDGQLLESIPLRGRAYFVGVHGDEIVVLTNERPHQDVRVFQLNPDIDDDGVPNEVDELEADPRASVDSDGDGTPDVWIDRIDTQGLEVDAFPLDPACQRPEHGLPDDPNRCDFSRAFPDYKPVDLDVDAHGIIYSLSSIDPLIFRWSIEEGRAIEPIKTDRLYRQAIFHPGHERLYLVDEVTNLFALDLGEGMEGSPIARWGSSEEVTNLKLVGDYLWVEWGIDDYYGPRGNWRFLDRNGVAVVDELHGALIASVSGTAVYPKSYHLWGPDSNALYWVLYEDESGLRINGVGSAFGAAVATVDDPLQLPIVPSPDGQRLVLSSGHVIDEFTLELLGRVSSGLVGMAWRPNGLVTIRETSSNQTAIETWSEALDLLETTTLPGEPLGVFTFGEEAGVVTFDGSRPDFVTTEAGSFQAN